MDGQDYRAHIESLAKIAYGLHELGTQLADIARREVAGAVGDDVRETALDEHGVHVLASCSTVLIEHSTYARSCAIQARNTAILTDRLRARIPGRGADTGGAGDTDHQWWTDLTTRPITSKVRDTVAAITTSSEMSLVLDRLADETDVLGSELDDAFVGTGWTRPTVSVVSVAASEIRNRSNLLKAREH